jgi:hypothetical protein
MTFKDSFKTRYGNGRLKESLMRIAELILVALFAGALSMWGTVGKIETRIEERNKAVDLRLDKLYLQGQEVRSDLRSLSDCLLRHLQESIPRR